MNSINLRKRLGLLLVILSAPLAGVSAAGLIDSGYSAGSNTNLNANVNSAVETNVRVNDNAGLNANTHENVNVDANGSAGIPNTGTAEGSASSTDGRQNAIENSQGPANASVSGQANSSSFILNQDSEEVRTRTGANVAADAVATDADLKAFAASSLRNDPNLSAMGFADDHVNINYKEPGRFLGFIPMNLSVGVTVSQDGSVDLSYPWYSFLVLSDKSNIEAAVQNEVHAFLSENGAVGVPNTGVEATSTASTTVNANATSTAFEHANANSALFTPRIRASLAERIQAVLRSHLISASGTATTTQSGTLGY